MEAYATDAHMLVDVLFKIILLAHTAITLVIFRTIYGTSLN